MNIALITYNCSHKKTHQVLIRLLLRDEHRISICFAPFSPRPARKVLFQHRPEQSEAPHPLDIARAYGLNTFHIGDWKEYRGMFDAYLICGAGLLDAEFVTANRVINCHPGLLPQTRGLDSFKWAIFHNNQVGNTLHYIDGEIDMGRVIHHQETPLFPSDTLETFAARHYEIEIELLANFGRYMKWNRVFSLPIGSPSKRMPADIEANLPSCFEGYKAASNTTSSARL